MNEEKKYQSIIEKKCSPCYKKDWCMLTPYQRAEECLGPFMDEEDNWKKYREYFEKEEKQKADIDRAVREVVLNTFLRNIKSLDRKNDNSEKKTVKRKSAAACPAQLSLEWAGRCRRGDKK